eukprot:TRINITY_DN2626_c0_g1_i3.p1 TRINITY_DN2626_c0_g1~~TRINITY_DN2626_c0_g1_i3.p1  ORF type:complete len:647 (-),score=130.28 TRINITY_DN2626_c0_g1_i3:44-1792(-)
MKSHQWCKQTLMAAKQHQKLAVMTLDNNVHVYYIGIDNHVHELGWRNDEWQNEPVSQKTTAPTVDASASSIVFWVADGSVALYYVGVDHHIHQIFWNRGWHCSNITQENHQYDLLSNFATDLHIFNSRVMCFRRKSDGLIQFLQFEYNSWRLTHRISNSNNPSIAYHNFGIFYESQGKLVQHDPHTHQESSIACIDRQPIYGPASISKDGDHLHIYFSGSDRHIYEIYHNTTSQEWRCWNITKASHAPLIEGHPETQSITRHEDVSSMASHFYISSKDEKIFRFSWSGNWKCDEISKAKLKILNDVASPERKSKAWLENIEVKREIGRGSFGNVYQATWNETTRIALKSVTGDPTELEKEAEILSCLRHPNVVAYLGLYRTSNLLYMAMEYLEASLLTLLKDEPLSLKCQISVALDVVMGMSYLSNQNIVHRDLAARNLLCARKGRDSYVVKVADFGLSRTLVEDYYLTEKRIVAIKWTAPEAIKFRKFSAFSDVWSFGVVLWEIFTRGQVPYPGLSSEECIAMVTDGHNLPNPENCPDEIYSIMTDCWHRDPKERPNWKTLFHRIHSVEMEETQSGYSNRV